MNKSTTTNEVKRPDSTPDGLAAKRPNRKMAAVAFWMLRQRLEELQRGVLHLRTLSSNRVDEDALPLSCIENMLSLASTQALSLEHAAHAGGVGDLTKPMSDLKGYPVRARVDGFFAETSGEPALRGVDVRVGDQVSWPSDEDGGLQLGVVQDVQETLVFVDTSGGDKPCQPIEKSKLVEVVR